MSNAISLSRPYAEAIFALADKKKWQDLLHNLAIIMQDSDMQELVGSPKIPAQDLSSIFNKILQLKDREQLEFVTMLLENKRMHLAEHILTQYIALCNEADNIQPATIISAHKLNPAQQKDVIAALKAKTGAEIKADFIIDKTIIGGLVIKVKDKVIDKSTSSMLTQMKNQMIQTKDISYAT